MTTFWTRDNPLWNALLVIGGTITLTLAPFEAADLGMDRVSLTWVRIIAAVVAGIGGKLGNSKLPGEHDHRQDP